MDTTANHRAEQRNTDSDTYPELDDFLIEFILDNYSPILAQSMTAYLTIMVNLGDNQVQEPFIDLLSIASDLGRGSLHQH
jgi:hypothetical protein